MSELPISEEMLAAFGAAAHRAGASTYMSGGVWRMEVTEEQVSTALADVRLLIRAEVADEIEAVPWYDDGLPTALAAAEIARGE